MKDADHDRVERARDLVGVELYAVHVKDWGEVGEMGGVRRVVCVGPRVPAALVGASVCFFFSSRRRHTRFDCDWSSDVCSSDLLPSTSHVRPRLTVRITPPSLATIIECGCVPGSQTTEFSGRSGRLPAGLPAVPLGREGGGWGKRVDVWGCRVT